MENSEPCFSQSAPRTPSMSILRLLAYGAGHFHNDMCASMWFTYLLIFTTRVLGFSSSKAGHLILIGQIADAICTPLVGFESDRTDWHCFCVKYGRRKSWHLTGFICVACSFTFIFVECFGCTYKVTSEWIELGYYVPFVLVFQFGWACVQISHLALIPELSTCQHERASLNGIRYAFSVFGNMLVFLLVYYFVGLVDAGHKNITQKDGISFTYVALAVTGIGSFFSIFFHFGANESMVKIHEVAGHTIVNQQGADSSLLPQQFTANFEQKMSWKDWFKVFDFYLIAAIYTSARIFANLTQAYLPLYVLETQHFEKAYIALIPLVVYTSSFATSTVMSFRAISRFIPHKIFVVFGILLGTGSCIWMWFHELHRMVYAVSVLLGMASTILLVTSLSLISDLINKNTESGAFVYGCMSCLDKLSTGIAIQIIQSLQPDCALMPCIGQDFYFRGVMVFVPCAALFVMFVALCILWPRNIGERQFEVMEEMSNSDEDLLLGS